MLLLPCGYASFGRDFTQQTCEVWRKQNKNKTKEQRAKKYLCTSCRFPSVTHRPPKLNRPLPSSKNPHFQNKARCTTFLVKMSFICMRIKNDFLIKGWAPTLVLKQRPGGTRKCPLEYIYKYIIDNKIKSHTWATVSQQMVPKVWGFYGKASLNSFCINNSTFYSKYP